MKKIIRRSAYAGALAVGLAFVSNFAYAHDASNGTTGQRSGRTWSNAGNWTHDTLPGGQANSWTEMTVSEREL